MATNWQIEGRELVNCNCAYGCPCQFNALPTHGNCHAFIGYQIDKGHFGDVRLDGLRAALILSWPGPIHEGNGTMQVIVDERADAPQREALRKIISGEDTTDMATMWWVYSKMSPNKLETLYKPIEFEMNTEKRTGRLSIPGLAEMTGAPIHNPVTGAEHRVRIDLPHGFEYRIAEIGSASSSVKGQLPMELKNTYGQFAELHLSDTGVIR
ncbi:MAG TPA: DUF1326 domain-containing protein [Candidatus Eremiobacteraceae bacterium]|nr:DUF1326 domain-containing protein [Candidatus Eremiobacteraceae bacterium]